MTSQPATGIEPGFQHFVLTRYFVRFSDAPQDAVTGSPEQRAWLAERLVLFRRYCLPSVTAQTVQDFTWLVYFDRNTPADALEQVRELVRSHPNIHVMLCDRFDDEVRRRDIAALLRPGVGWLLTTRLDNDDGWRADFVQRLQSEVRPGRREFLNFPTGILLYDDMTFLYRHDSNAFISLSEPADDFVTVICAPHTDLSAHGTIRQLPPQPAFIQVIHPGTRSNKPRGVRVHRLLALAGFEALFGENTDADAETDWRIVGFNATRALAWAARDRLIALGRGLAMQFRSRRPA